MSIEPNVNLKKEGILCTLNVNMSTKESTLWLKKKLKSSLMNNVSFYFRETTNTKEASERTLKKLYQVAAEKYVVCAAEFKAFHMRAPQFSEEEIDLRVVQVIYIVIRSFFKYLVCNVRDPIMQKDEYQDFLKNSLYFFIIKFGHKKNVFRRVWKILVAKEKKLIEGGDGQV
jgi:hypothetical protein